MKTTTPKKLNVSRAINAPEPVKAKVHRNR
jgi:hypothetical protein